MLKRSENETQQPNVVVRAVDYFAVACIKFFITMATIKSRDPNERFSNVFKADRQHQTRIRNWQAVLEWSPEKRAAWCTAMLVGALAGFFFIWWNLD